MEESYPPPCIACNSGDCLNCLVSAGMPCGCFDETCDKAEAEDRRRFPEDYEDISDHEEGWS